MHKEPETLLITGGRGFIGSNMVDFFKQNYTVISPTHQELDLLEQEQVSSFFKNNSIDYVIHGANVGGNRSSTDGPEVVEKNVRMFFNLCKNQNHFKKLINLGSGAEYSKEHMPSRVTESEFGKFIPTDYYGFSKYIISKYIENTSNIYCLRLFGVFGPGEDYRYKFISNSILKNILKMPIKIMQNVYFDWVFIDDLLHIIEYFLKNNPSLNSYNITPEKATDILSIARIINQMSDFQSEIIIVNPGLNREYSGDNKNLKSEMGNYEFMSMDESIKRLIDYYQSNLDFLDLEIIREDPFASRCKINKE
jgi:nucleoside-diphosphate-sugar epimerase